MIHAGRHHNAAFLWGPRKAGKTTLPKQRYGAARYFDLLQRSPSARKELREIIRNRVGHTKMQVLSRAAEIDLLGVRGDELKGHLGSSC